MHSMQPVVTDVRCVCPSVCPGAQLRFTYAGVIRLPNHFRLLFSLSCRLALKDAKLRDSVVSSASEVTTLWRYTNLFIIIIFKVQLKLQLNYIRLRNT